MADDRPVNLSAGEALERLQVGNERFVSDSPVRPRDGAARRKELVAAQSPFATIITCADSRVPAELVFDQGLGDLFVIRVAGNISDDAVLGSVEYASLHLGVNLIVVMGHLRCGERRGGQRGLRWPGDPQPHRRADRCHPTRGTRGAATGKR